MVEEENKELVIYGYKNSEGKCCGLQILNLLRLEQISLKPTVFMKKKLHCKKKNTKFLFNSNKKLNFVKDLKLKVMKDTRYQI